MAYKFNAISGTFDIAGIGGGGGGANTALSNLAAVAINTSLISDIDNTDALGSAAVGWTDLFLSDAGGAPTTNGQISYNAGNTRFEFYQNGGVVALGGGGGDITSIGDVVTGAAFDGTQGTLLTFFNAGGNATLGYNGTTFTPSVFITSNITGDLTGNADTVTTNANLTGGVTSVGNAATVITNANLTGGVTSVGNAATVITNANLTGDVTSIGNATTNVTNANLTGIVTSIGNATAIADKAIAIAKLADGIDGNLITWDVNGVIDVVATGDAGQVLTSNGADTVPTFQAAGGGNTLDAAYDQGGAGVGRTINVTDGAVVLAGAETTTNVFEITDATLTTGDGANILSTSTARTSGSLLGVSQTGNSAGANTGGLAFFTSSDTSATVRNLVTIQNTAGTGGRCLLIDQDADNISLNIQSEATTVNTVNITADSQTTGNILTMSGDGLTAGSIIAISSDSASTTARGLLDIVQDNAAANGATPLTIQQDGIQEAILIDKNNTGISIDIAADVNSASAMYAIRTNIANAGAGLEYLLDMDGSEVVSAAVGGSQDKKIRVRIAGTDYFIPCHTA